MEGSAHGKHDSYETLEAHGARTQSLFRDVNERVREINEAFNEVLPLGDWVCECANDRCTERLHMSPRDYGAQRQDCPHCISSIPAGATTCAFCTKDVSGATLVA